MKQPHQLQCDLLQAKWKIKGFHFRDLDLSNTCKNFANVLSKEDKPIMIKFYHILKHRDNLFIIHENLEFRHMAGNKEMSISHLKTGKPLLDFTMKLDETISDMEGRAVKQIEDMVNKYGERFAMERIKGPQGINVKYNVFGY